MILKVASKFVLTSANLKEFRTNAGELTHLIIEKTMQTSPLLPRQFLMTVSHLTSYTLTEKRWQKKIPCTSLEDWRCCEG